jgi:hypothetical protein
MIIIGAVLLVIILIWNILTPSSSTKGTAGLEPIGKAKQDTKVNVATQARLTREVKDLAPKVNDLAYNLAPDELVPRTVKELQEIAAKSGVHIREVKPARPKLLPSGMGSSVPLEVHFLAPFQPNAMKFLYYVEDPSWKMVIDKLDISSADPRLKTVEVSATVTVFTKVTSGAGASDTGDRSNAASTN